jgi:hypothetical protein
MLTVFLRTPKKPKSKKMISLSAAINASNVSAVKGSAVKQEGDKVEDTARADDPGGKHADEEGDERVGQKRKRYITVVENGKKRKIVDQVGIRIHHGDICYPIFLVLFPSRVTGVHREIERIHQIR